MAAPHVAGAYAVLRQMMGCRHVIRLGRAVEEILGYLAGTGVSVADNRPATKYPDRPAGTGLSRPRINVHEATHRLDTVYNSGLPQAPSYNTLEGSIADDTNRCATKDIALSGGNVVPEPNHGGNRGGASAWYRWTAPATGRVRFSTMGSTFDTLLAAYESSPTDLFGGTLRAQNDDAGGTLQSLVEFDATADRVYYIAVDGFRSSSSPYPAWGTVKLQWAQNRPPNDDFAAAAPVATQVTGSSARATSEFGEPSPTGPTVWFKWSAPSSQTATFKTAGSSFDTVLDVYRGTSLSNLMLVATNDDSPSGLWSQVTFSPTAGTTYYLRLRGFAGAAGPYTITRGSG